MQWRSVALVVVAACGRLHFDPMGASSDGGDGPTGDSSSARPNVVFVTTARLPGPFGGMAVAEQTCRDAAASVGLPGTFLPWLSTSTLDAVDRFSGSRGWVRVDGAPVADTLAELLAGKIYNPISISEAGTTVLDAIWTGTGPDGRAKAGSTCSDWLAAGAGATGTTAAPQFSAGGNYSCSGFSLPLACFEVGHDFVVSPQPTVPARIAFLSGPTALSGVAGLDAQCQSEANAAGLTGMFVAAVATNAASAASRATIDTTPWMRVDGTLVTASGGALFSAGTLTSFVNQSADGTYLFSTRIIVGAMGAMTAGTVATTCNDWSGTNGQPVIGDSGAINSQFFWYAGNLAACTAPLPPALCVER